MIKHVCIIGGSGFVGRAIVKQALAAGYQVRVACRHPERARDLLVLGARLIALDLTDSRGLDRAIEGADCVINLVGLLFERGRYSFDAVHVHGTEHILTACQRHNVKQYLHMSALGANASSESLYARTKGMAEERVRQSDLAWTIVQPSIIYGAGDSFFCKFKELSAMLPILPVIAAKTRFQPVWVEDVARVFVQSIGNRHVASQTYALAGPKAYSFKQLMTLLMLYLHRQRILLPVPNAAAKVLAGLSNFLPTPIITADQLKLLADDNIIEGEHFPSQFGTAARLEHILPTYIESEQAGRLQSQFDQARTGRREH